MAVWNRNAVPTKLPDTNAGSTFVKKLEGSGDRTINLYSSPKRLPVEGSHDDINQKNILIIG